MLGFSSLSEFSISELPSNTAQDNGLLGGGGYVHPYARYREEEYQRQKIAAHHAALKEVEEELAQREREAAKAAEQERLAAHIEAELEAKQRLLLAELREEISRLRMGRVWLMRLIDDEEAILVLLLSTPFH